MKVLECGINASSSQWCGCIFILCYTHLKLALLLNKQDLVATGVATTVAIASSNENVKDKDSQSVAKTITDVSTSFQFLMHTAIHQGFKYLRKNTFLKKMCDLF